MRRLLTVCVLLLATVMGLWSCSGYAQDHFAYTNASFSAEVRGELCRTVEDGYRGQIPNVGESRTGVPMSFSAVVTVAFTQEGSMVSVTYTSPESLAGLTVRRETHISPDGTQKTATTASYGSMAEISLSETAAQGLLRPADAFFPQGDVTSVSPARDGLTELTVTSSEADRGTAIFSFPKDSSLPASIFLTCSTYTLTLTVTQMPAS